MVENSRARYDPLTLAVDASIGKAITSMQNSFCVVTTIDKTLKESTKGFFSSALIPSVEEKDFGVEKLI